MRCGYIKSLWYKIRNCSSVSHLQSYYKNNIVLRQHQRFSSRYTGVQRYEHLINAVLLLYLKKCIWNFFITHSLSISLFIDNNRSNWYRILLRCFLCSLCNLTLAPKQILQSRRYNLEYWNCCHIISRLAGNEESGPQHYRWLPINTRHIRPSPICNLYRDNNRQF